jgi:hypothetical protein
MKKLITAAQIIVVLNVIKRVRLNDAGDGLIYEAP